MSWRQKSPQKVTPSLLPLARALLGAYSFCQRGKAQATATKWRVNHGNTNTAQHVRLHRHKGKYVQQDTHTESVTHRWHPFAFSLKKLALVRLHQQFHILHTAS